jgi:hypothetical protein
MGSGGHRFGAGRPGWHVKAEHCLKLKVRDLARHGLLARTGTASWRWSNTETGEELGSINLHRTPDALRLTFTWRSQPIEQRVALESTPCNYGGTPTWLRCPRCQKRIAVLFLRAGHFMCRQCWRIAYASQSDDVFGASLRRERRLARKLVNDWGRPAGMHQRTSAKLLSAILQCNEQREEAVLKYLARINFKLWALDDRFGLDL